MQFAIQHRTAFQRLPASDTNLFCFQWLNHSQVVLFDVFFKKIKKETTQSLPEIMKPPFLKRTLAFCSPSLTCSLFSAGLTSGRWLFLFVYLVVVVGVFLINGNRIFFLINGNRSKYTTQRYLVKVDAQNEWIFRLFFSYETDKTESRWLFSTRPVLIRNWQTAD